MSRLTVSVTNVPPVAGGRTIQDANYSTPERQSVLDVAAALAGVCRLVEQLAPDDPAPRETCRALWRWLRGRGVPADQATRLVGPPEVNLDRHELVGLVDRAARAGQPEPYGPDDANDYLNVPESEWAGFGIRPRGEAATHD